MTGKAMAFVITLVIIGVAWGSSAAVARKRTTGPTPPSSLTRSNTQSGQEASQPDAGVTSHTTPPPTGTEDLQIDLDFHAQEMHFKKSPQTHIEFSGGAYRYTYENVQRENLPRDIKPGTYRNVSVHVSIISAFPDIDRIVAEALGAEPPPPASTPPPPASAPPTPGGKK